MDLRIMAGIGILGTILITIGVGICTTEIHIMITVTTVITITITPTTREEEVQLIETQILITIINIITDNEIRTYLMGLGEIQIHREIA